MAFGKKLSVNVHVDEQKIVTVEFFSSLDKCVDFPLLSLFVADVVRDLYELLHLTVLCHHEVHLPLPVTIIEYIFVLRAVTPQQFNIYHILQSPPKVCGGYHTFPVGDKCGINDIDFFIKNTVISFLTSIAMIYDTVQRKAKTSIKCKIFGD